MPAVLRRRLARTTCSTVLPGNTFVRPCNLRHTELASSGRRCPLPSHTSKAPQTEPYFHRPYRQILVTISLALVFFFFFFFFLFPLLHYITYNNCRHWLPPPELPPYCSSRSPYCTHPFYISFGHPLNRILSRTLSHFIYLSYLGYKLKDSTGNPDSILLYPS
jgi:hypothetical protein